VEFLKNNAAVIFKHSQKGAVAQAALERANRINPIETVKSA